MASYSIHWKSSAEKELKRIDRRMIPRIIKAVESLANNPHPAGSKKLQGAERLWRIRSGDYRVIYSVNGDQLCIEVIKIGHRQSVYR